jgi:hypothetical protein
MKLASRSVDLARIAGSFVGYVDAERGRVGGFLRRAGDCGNADEGQIASHSGRDLKLVYWNTFPDRGSIRLWIDDLPCGAAIQIAAFNAAILSCAVESPSLRV